MELRQVRLIGIEPITYCLEGSCSIQMSYRRIFFVLNYYTNFGLQMQPPFHFFLVVASGQYFRFSAYVFQIFRLCISDFPPVYFRFSTCVFQIFHLCSSLGFLFHGFQYSFSHFPGCDYISVRDALKIVCISVSE